MESITLILIAFYFFRVAECIANSKKSNYHRLTIAGTLLCISFAFVLASLITILVI